jgi:hypothetical protein
MELLFELETNSIEENLAQFSKSIEPLYTVFLLFLNSVIMDFIMDFLIMLCKQDKLLLTVPPAQLARKSSRALIIAIAGGGLVGAYISISPAVELPGVNFSQIHFGRGYGYETPLDWGKGQTFNQLCY